MLLLKDSKIEEERGSLTFKTPLTRLLCLLASFTFCKVYKSDLYNLIKIMAEYLETNILDFRLH